MILLYWDIGSLILDRQDKEGWGARVIDRLASDIRGAFSDIRGMSPRNLKYMRAFAAAWADRRFVQEALAQIPWYHHIALLEKCRTFDERLWYARQSLAKGWSHSILSAQIRSRVHERQGKAISNFKRALPSSDSDMASQIFKDPYLFDFLGTADPRRESEVEQALVSHVQRFLLELGTGFAFVGRQVLIEVGNRDFYIDLLFYHLQLRRYVVIELKAVPFEPAFVGQLNLYLSAADDLLKHRDDKSTIGLLLCRSKDKLVAEYALRDFKKPIGVADWETKLLGKLPKELKSSLPTVEEIETELTQGR
jgi:predicted nuclease of restriction endonuclease-like (RecB) superfamily